MAKFNSKVSKFLIKDTGGTVRDLSAYLTEISGIPGERELIPWLTIGGSSREKIPSVENNGPIRLAGFFDDTATSGPDIVLAALRTYETRTEFNYGPKGSTTGFRRFDGFVFVRRYEVRSIPGELVAFVAELEVDGAITSDVSAFIT